VSTEPTSIDTSLALVLTTAPDMVVAESLASRIVEERLAACVNLVPGVTSIFRWQDSIERDSEVLLLVKTTAEAVAALRDRIVALHPYDVPEVVALSASGGHAPYLEWVRGQVGGGK